MGVVCWCNMRSLQKGTSAVLSRRVNYKWGLNDHLLISLSAHGMKQNIAMKIVNCSQMIQPEAVSNDETRFNINNISGNYPLQSKYSGNDSALIRLFYFSCTRITTLWIYRCSLMTTLFAYFDYYWNNEEVKTWQLKDFLLLSVLRQFSFIYTQSETFRSLNFWHNKCVNMSFRGVMWLKTAEWPLYNHDSVTIIRFPIDVLFHETIHFFSKLVLPIGAVIHRITILLGPILT